MALTLAEGAKLSNDVLLEGVIETTIIDSPVLQRMPFIEIIGNGLTYNREATAATAGFYAVGDTWTEDTPTFAQVTAALSILGGDADVDHYLAGTRHNVQDLEAAVVALKAKAVQQQFDDTFINGDTGTAADSFDGLDVLCAAGQTVTVGANGGTLTLERMDELIDTVRGGKPDMLLMSRRTRRTLTNLARATGLLETDRDEFGRAMQFYDGVPVGVHDFIADDQTVGTSTDCSTVFALQFGEGGVAGLTGPEGLMVERVGSLESKDATRIRVKWYVAIALFNELKLAKLTGVRT